MTALITALFGAGGMGFIVLGLASYQGSLEFQPQSSAYISKFSSLNDIPSLAGTVLDANGNAISGQFVTGQRLRELFVREFADYRELRSAIEAVNPAALVGFDGTPAERNSEIIDLARDYSLTTPMGQELANAIAFSGQDPVEIRAVLNAALPAINRSVSDATLNNIRNLRETTRVSIMNQLDAVQRDLDTKVRAYEFRTAGRVAFLREQAAIARELDIAEGDFRGVRGDSGVSVTVESDRPFYARGYRAIEKEIELIEGRLPSQYGQYIEGYFDQLEQREALLADTRIAQIDRAIDQPPLGDDFQAVVIDLDLMEVKSSKKSALILALSMVLGGMFAVLFVLMRSGYHSYQKRKVA